ncbi:MAG: hypothetical protein PHI37_04085 [Candidatus Gracilibacteria bacterium]|nr:hypothetical protein [Candidatus Gracilibacteria bacterium]
MVLKEKKEKNLLLKKKLLLSNRNKAIGLIKINSKTLIKELRDALVVLPCDFVIEVEGANNEKLAENVVAISKVDDNSVIGFDFIVCDDEINNLNSYFELGITPIVSNKNHLSSLLKEFNPVKNEGNSYIYSSLDKWSIFYALIRYLENYKFPFDNKNLVKNVINF